MRIALIDSLENECKQFDLFIQKALTEFHDTSEIHVFSDGASFLKEHRKEPFPLICVAMKLSDMTGPDLIRKVREVTPITIPVLLASPDDKWAEAFSVHAFDYLVKPFYYKQVHRLFYDLFDLFRRREPHLDLRIGGKMYHFLYNDIRYIMSDSNYCTIMTTSFYRARTTFQSILEKLKDPRFLLINRGIIINMDHVTGIDNQTIILDSSYSFPLNRRRATELQQTYIDYQFRIHSCFSGPQSS